MVKEYQVRCLGEIGLDKRYGEKTYNRQLEFLRSALEIASSMNLVVNIHALDSWSDVFSLLTKYDIKKAIFHWYTGPINLLKEIESQGYFITINPALVIQRKHRKIAEISEVSHILTESDGPYEYHGLFLYSGLIPSLIKQLAQLKEVEEDTLGRQIYANFRKLLSE